MDGSAQAHYELARWLYQQYDKKTNDLEPLDLALIELENVSNLDAGHADAKVLLGIVTNLHESGTARKHPSYLDMFFLVVGGLGIFLLGMKNMSEGMQAIAGTRLRKMINAVTDNRLMATGVGTGMTCLVQSSSITTVIVVGLVNSGLMALHQAVGVIMGANIGTTITGWIIFLDQLFEIGKYGWPILGFAVFVHFFSKRDRWRFTSMTVMGLGMIFLGLATMKHGFAPMKDVEAFAEAFRMFDASTYLGVLACAAVGCVLTFVVQSSSATLGITISLAVVGVIPFETAGALVLGENIGTTITAWLASFGATTNAKRAAYAHVLFNVVGCFWITAIYSWLYLDIIGYVVETVKGFNPVGASMEDAPSDAAYATAVAFGIAIIHTGFNVTNTLMFLPFVRKFATFLEWLIPDKELKETPHLSSLDYRVVESPVIGLEQSRGEIIKMAAGIQKMLGWTSDLVQQEQPEQKMVEKVFNRERIMDSVEQEIIQFMTNLMTSDVPYTVAEEGRRQIRIADEFESISDYISAVLKSHLRIVQYDLKITGQEAADLNSLHGMVSDYVRMAAQAFEENHADVLVKAQTQGEFITAKCKEMREAHLQYLTDNRVNPILSMSYTTMVQAYRKIKDHALNITEAIAGRK